MVLGLSDVGTTDNKELPEIASRLEKWFKESEDSLGEVMSQGWLEYLFVT